MSSSDEETKVLSFHEVLAEERSSYLDERRRLNGLPPIGTDREIWGLSLSGGGIRSATFCLGVLQSFMKAKVMKRFDYLSTVSGGGYIGACLSSLFAGEAGKDPDLALDENGSPFVGLRATEGDREADHTRLGVRHQMHHLRSHGEYLMPRSGLFRLDFQRFLGAGGLGIFYTFLLFLVGLVLLVSLLHLVFAAADPTLESLSPPGPLRTPAARDVTAADPGIVSRVTTFLSGIAHAWWTQRFLPPLQGMTASAFAHPLDGLGMGVLGALWAVAWISIARKRAPRLQPRSHSVRMDTPAGWTAADRAQSRLITAYNRASFAAAGLATLGWSAFRSAREGDYLGGFWLPFAFACAGWLVSFLFMSVAETLRDIRAKAHPEKEPLAAVAQARRSLYDAIGGANLLGMLAALLVPFVSVLTFSLARLPNKFFLAAGLALCGIWLTRGHKTAAIDKGRFLPPLLDGLVLLFLLLSASRVSETLLALQRGLHHQIAFASTASALAAVASLLLLGFLFDPNRISPHHFYSDRLAEAYLRTDGRVKLNDSCRERPLATIRDDEQLELTALGKPTRAPFHLIVAALNLADSDELVRKRLKSDHFVFSGLHVGSRTTGFVRTEEYRGGHTRLATALATSAAAVASAAGLNTRRSVAFLATLFNGRLGLWIENPRKYCERESPTRPLTFWPWRLLQEIFGTVNGNGRLVNVSDGGHTGDNLGLMPLLQRRCHLIVVCDAEADANLDFDSLRHVVRMANVELNIEIEIDLGPVQRRRMARDGLRTCEASVVEGIVHYPKTADRDEQKGRLIYVKSSVSRAARVPVVGETPRPVDPVDSPGASQTPSQGRTLPASVASYLRENADFPHQTTVDQFFDDGQFEAYRALGAYLGKLAAVATGSGS